eukprot:gene9826-10669_t
MRVDKELANIRSIFATAANLTSYDKKIYVWKLCYIYMLGYEVDFGHVEFISLLSSTKFREKSIGYMAFSLMFRPGNELMMLAVNSIRNDIVGPFNAAQTLALAAVSNMGGKDLAEALSGDVQRLIVSPLQPVPSYSLGQNLENEFRNKSQLCKKASICLLRLFQTNPECVILDEWVMRLAKLLEDRDMGVVTSILSLLLAFASYSPPIFEPLVPYVISVFTRLVVNRSCPADYLYYHNPSPWIQVKCLRFLQYYKIPEDRTQVDLLQAIMSKILIKTEVSESDNKCNADHSVLFEAINLVIIYGSECPAQLRDRTADLLGKFISTKDANIRYLGIEAMTRFANLGGPQVAERYQTDVLDCLNAPDISLIKRALNLLDVMTYEKNARDIVGELVVSLPRSNIVMKEEIVVKIAILAEKYSNNSQWYLDTMIQVILLAGDYVAEAVWYRIVQIVINNSDIHEYAAEKLLTSVQSKYAHEIVVAVATYLLGEIGVKICEKPGMTGYDQFVALHQHFANASLKTQSLMLTTYVKLLNLYPDQIRDLVIEVFNNHNKNNNGHQSNQIRPFLRITSSEEDIGDMNHQPPLSSENNNNENSNSDNRESSVILPTIIQPSYLQTTAINPMITSSNTANVAQANHGNTPQPPPQNTPPHNWSTSLFDCLQEEESCWWSFWCCCVVAARNAGEVGLGDPKMHIFLFVAALFFGWLLIVLHLGLAGPLLLIGVAVYYVYYRTNIRQQIKAQLHILIGEWMSDCLLHCCCACCAIAQEARESLTAPRNKRLDYCSAQDLAEIAPAANELFHDVEQGPVANSVERRSIHKLSVTSQNIVIVLGVLSLGLVGLFLLVSTLAAVILLLIFLQPLILLYFLWRSRRNFAQLDYVIKMFFVGFFISTIQSILLEEILKKLVTLLGLLLFFLTSSYTLSSPLSDATSSSSSSAAFSAMLGQLSPTRGSFLYEADSSHVSLFTAYTSYNTSYDTASHPLSPRINLASSNSTSFNPDEIPRDLLAHNLWLVLFVLFLMTFVVMAGVEESMKHFAVRCCRFATPLKDPHVVLVYLVAAALGFATAENLEYVFGVHVSPIPGTSRFWGEFAVLRTRLLMPIHLICAVLQAAQMAQVVLGIAPQLNLGKVLLPAIVLHGSFEYFPLAIGAIQYAFDLELIALDVISMVIPIVITVVGAIWAHRSYTEVEQRFQQNWRTITTQEDEGLVNTLL